MLKGQLSIAFVVQILLTAVLMIALVIITGNMSYSVKKQTQMESFAGIATSIAEEVLAELDYLEINSTSTTLVRVPFSKDATSGQYSIELVEIGNSVYVEVRSAQFTDVVSRQPLYLDSSKVIASGKSFPPEVCLDIARNETHYTIKITC